MVTIVCMRDAILVWAYLRSLLWACVTPFCCGLICCHYCVHARRYPGVGLFAVTVVGMREAILVWAYLRSLLWACAKPSWCGLICGHSVCCAISDAIVLAQSVG